ncbi:MAG TPA: alpha/beta fold hydrolase [Corynebacteriales bacterium]|nr:alpha/beta fold hydrolase [Mycobacteriales bacterium]
MSLKRRIVTVAGALATSIALVMAPTNAFAEPVEGSVDTIETETSPELSTIQKLYPDPVHKFVPTKDGMKVSVFEYGPSPAKAETIIMTGGWPWTSSGMDAFARVLATKYHVVRYDQRGSGESSHPKEENMYTFQALANEMLAVIRHTTLPGQKVHVFGEAWCPFIASQLNFMYPGIIATITSLGAPSLDLAVVRHRQALESKDPYTRFQAKKQAAVLEYAFILERSPEKFIKYAVDTNILAGITDTGVKLLGGDFPGRTNNYDIVHGMQKYRVAWMQSWNNPQYDYLDVPVVHVLHMEYDLIETDYLLDNLEASTPHYIRHDIKSDHLTWVTSITSVIEYIEETIETYHEIYD